LHEPCPGCGRAQGGDAVETVPGVADATATFPGSGTDEQTDGEFGRGPVESETSTDASGRATHKSTSRPYSRSQPPHKDDHHGLMPGQNFGQRYHIVRLLGMGGMGAVYQAWDTELGVVVALKVIRPEAAADAEAAQALERRFKQELLLARLVTHKNVVRIHDLGELQGIKYITMPYIEGEDLSTILKREGALDVRRTVQIARSMISGLAAAHAAGVVHRDLKPANIMVDGEGNALIMDFGIARSVTRPSSAATIAGLKPMRVSGDETTLGSVVGTVQYMAPEQARGLPVDHRADIYAFGLILYDLLLGRQRAMRTDSAMAELNLRLQQAPPAPRTLDPNVPAALDRIVMRCVQPDANARYATTAELVADFDRLDANGKPLPIVRRLTTRMVGAALALLVALVALTWWLARGPATPVERPPVPVLIADFENSTGDPVFSGVVEQGLAIGLEGAPFVTMYPRGDAQRIAAGLNLGSRLDEGAARLVSRREGVKMIVAGAIAMSGGRYTITARLIDSSVDGGAITTATASAASKGDVLPAVVNVTSRIRTALGDTDPVGGRAGDAETFTTTSLEAMSAYTRGQAHYYAGRQREALAAFEEAVRLDPALARAYAGMGVIYGGSKQDDKARAAYDQALKHIDRMTEREKFRTLGGYFLVVTQDYESARENFERLVQKYPADNTGHANLAFAYLKLGNTAKAVEEGREAIEIYPKNHLQRLNYAMYAMYAGDFATAIQQADIILEDNPDYTWAYFARANAQLASGDSAAARTAFEQLKSRGPEAASIATLALADVALYDGRVDDATRILQDGIAVDERGGDSGNAAFKYVALAEARMSARDRAGALRAAERAAASRQHESVLFPAALVLIDAGKPDAAAALARTLSGMLQQQTTAYSRLITGRIALAKGDVAAALEAFRDAEKRYNSWFAHLLLGRLYLQAGRFGEAVAQFDECLKRRGEAADVFFENTTTSHYVPPLYYWLAKAHEGLGAAAAAKKNYEQYLSIRGNAVPADAMAADARARVGR
jgi:eukaryotic-like serine/threonine-protein kinase